MVAYSNYPSKLDDSLSIPAINDNVDKVNSVVINRLRDAILSIERELGTDPSGISGTVRERLDSSDIIINSINSALQELIITGGGSTIIIKKDDVAIGSGIYSTLNFSGAGVEVTDYGNNNVTITISGLDGYAVQSIVWKPGTATTVNHVETWAEVEAWIAASEQPAPLNVYVDDSTNPGYAATIPATADTDCLGQVSFISATPRSTQVGTTWLNFDDGARVRNPSGFIGVTIYAAPTSVSPVLIGGKNSIDLLTLRDASGIYSDAASVPIISAVQNSAIYIEGEAYLAADYTDVPLINISANKTCTIYLRDASINETPVNLIGGDASTTLWLSSAPKYVVQPLFSGTLHLYRYIDGGAINPSQGTTASRPTSPMTGEMYYDTDLDTPVWWDGAAWADNPGATPPTGNYLAKVTAGSWDVASVQVTDALVSASAAIAGTKIAPDFGAQNIITTGYESLGTTPSSTGDIRLPNLSKVAFRSAANDNDRSIFESGASNDLYVGTDASFTSTKLVSSLKIHATSEVGLGLAGVSYHYMYSGNNEMWKPITGSSIGSKPYGVHGLGTQAMADADQTPAASIYMYNTIATTGAITANKNLTLPAATDAACYTKIIDNRCTGDFAIIVKDSGAGTTVAVPNGTTATILMDSRGATLVSSKSVTSSGAIVIGTSPATAGDIRLSGENTIKMRNDANDGNYTALSDSAMASLGRLCVGYNGSAGGYSEAFPNVVISPTTATYIKVNNTTKLTVDSTTITSANENLQFTSGCASVLISQADLSSESGTGATLTIQAQDETGATSTGGSLNLTSGTGTSADGAVNLQVGGIDVISLDSPSQITVKAITQIQDGDGYVMVTDKIISGQTTDATPYELYTFTIPDEAVTIVDALVAGVQSTGATVASYKRSITFKRDGGTVTIINTVRDNSTDESTAGWDCTIDNSTSTARIMVTGGAINITWGARVSIMTVIP